MFVGDSFLAEGLRSCSSYCETTLFDFCSAGLYPNLRSKKFAKQISSSGTKTIAIRIKQNETRSRPKMVSFVFSVDASAVCCKSLYFIKAILID